MSLLIGADRRARTFSVVTAGAGAALALGVLLAVQPVGTAATLGAVGFLALAAIDVSFGIALWIPALFVVPGIVTSLMGLALAVAWMGSLISRRPRLRQVLPGQRLLIGALGLLLGWMSLSLLWASDPHVAWGDLRGWLIAAAGLIVVATSVTTPARLRLVLAAFLLGALLSVAIGLVTDDSPGRFAGAEGNPNDLAAQLLPVVVLGVALVADRRSAGPRLVLATCVAALVIALVATQSRGGLVAAAGTIVAAVVIYNRYRRYLLLTLITVLAVAGASFAASPGTFTRVTSFGDGGAGRTTLWEVAWRIAADHAPLGVGLNNFRVVSQDYVRRPGVLLYVGQIESPHVVHDTYLQLLAETGIPGLGLFLTVVMASLAALRRAALRFVSTGRHDLARLARAVLLAVVSVLAAQLFQSNGYDMGLWILLALGPAMLAMAFADRVIEQPLVDGGPEDTMTPTALSHPVDAAPG